MVNKTVIIIDNLFTKFLYYLSQNQFLMVVCCLTVIVAFY